MPSQRIGQIALIWGCSVGSLQSFVHGAAARGAASACSSMVSRGSVRSDGIVDTGGCPARPAPEDLLTFAGITRSSLRRHARTATSRTNQHVHFSKERGLAPEVRHSSEVIASHGTFAEWLCVDQEEHGGIGARPGAPACATGPSARPRLGLRGAGNGLPRGVDPQSWGLPGHQSRRGLPSSGRRPARRQRHRAGLPSERRRRIPSRPPRSAERQTAFS
jgi:hypothetical protein